MYTDSYKHRGQRNALIKLLREKGIRDERVLQAIGEIPRHFFFEKAFQEHAYHDKAFPIGQGQTISQPYTVAYQTELLELKPTDKVLEIGTGSGYQCWVLLKITPLVYTIEYNKVLFNKAAQFFKDMSLQPKIFQGDGSLGLPAHAPFDKILVTAGAPSIPKNLISQLKMDGILVIPVGDASNQKMIKVTRVGPDEFTREALDNFKFVPLLGKSGWNL